MFEKNEYVFHESGGICRITDICYAPLQGMPADRRYYVLKPLHDQSGVIYIPVDSDCIFLRRLLDSEQARELLDAIPSVEAIEETNAKLLRARYTECMKTHAPLEWVRVIKTVHTRMNTPSQRPQRLSETERSFAENARRNLHAELALALGMEEGQIESYITEYVANL